METAIRVANSDLELLGIQGRRNVTGPGGACVKSAQRIGWHFESASIVTDRNGRRLDLLEICPKTFAKLIEEAITSTLHS